MVDEVDEPGTDAEDDDELEPIGSLIDTPLPRLLLRIHRQALDGTLHLEAEGLKTWIHFDRGQPDGVHDPNAEIYLGMVLREQGVIDDADFQASLLKMAESGKLQGQVLLEMGKLDQAQLDRALETQQLRKAARLFELDAATYRFDEGAALPGRMMAHPVHPFAVVYHGIRSCYHDDELDRHLAPLAGKLCGAGPALGAHKADLRLPDEEAVDLELLSQHRSVEDFATRAGAGATGARMLLLALYWCDLLEISDPGLQPPKPPPAPRSNIPPRPAVPPPPAPAPAQAKEARPAPAQAKEARPAPAKEAVPPAKEAVPPALRERIGAKHQQAQQFNLLGLLEITADANDEQVRRAHAAMTKMFHPDRFARFADPALIAQVQLISARLNDALETLSDPQKRADYLNRLVGGEGRPITLNPQAAATAYEKAKVFLQKKELKRALDSLKLAARLDPSKADYHAQLVWVELLCAPEAGPEQLQQAKRELLKLRERSPSAFWVNRHLASICLRLEQNEEYGQYLERASNIRPKDIDTARELRLLKMRQEKAAEEKKKGGLFGRRG